MIGVRSTPNAGRFVKLIAAKGVGTTTCDHSRRLVGENLGWINQLRFQSDLVTHMFTILDLVDLPSTEGH